MFSGHELDLETYKARFGSDVSPGWDAIDAHLSDRYGQAQPDFHFGAVPPFSLGGPNPLDGVSFYIHRDPDHLHFVSYGLSNLYYDEEAAGGEFSGWGFELTFRLAVEHAEMPGKADDVPTWPMDLMQNLARYVLGSKKWFEQGHYIDAKGPVKAGSTTDKTAILFWNDPELQAIDTPHGRLEFLQIVGITADELGKLKTNEFSSGGLASKLTAADRLLITTISDAG